MLSGTFHCDVAFMAALDDVINSYGVQPYDEDEKDAYSPLSPGSTPDLSPGKEEEIQIVDDRGHHSEFDHDIPHSPTTPSRTPSDTPTSLQDLSSHETDSPSGSVQQEGSNSASGTDSDYGNGAPLFQVHLHLLLLLSTLLLIP
ncbi:hypothetical protein SK128_009356 [Halocaridina rubra]|uniref:Uncharacterized protein n=1 Tax=Halocaridina rubra TaxID=373956 RepID=A0AAN9A4B3_HALRR